MPKPKGTPGGNPNPVQTPEFLEKQFPAAQDLADDVELAKTALCVKLPVDIDEVVRSLPNRSMWIRQAIIEKLEREKLTANEVEPSTDHAIDSKATHKRQRMSSTMRGVVSSVKTEPDNELKPGQLIHNPAGWRGWVDKSMGGDRYAVTFENGITDEYPGHLLKAE